MSRLTKFAWLLTAVIMLSLTACGGGAAPTPTLDPAAVYTAAVETAYAQLTLTAMAVTKTPEPTFTLAAPTNAPTLAPTNTPLITNTPLPGLTPLPTNTPFSLSPVAPTQETCDDAIYLADVTIPDGTEVSPGEVFDKTWKVQNTGPCTWNKDYLLGFAYGEVMGSNYWAYITTTPVNPGAVLEVTVTLTAPTNSGSYFGAWRLQNDRGTKFGPFLTIVIKVP